MRLFKSPTAFYKVHNVEGKDEYTPITQADYAKLYEAQQLKRTVQRGLVTGGSIATGMATGETGGSIATGMATGEVLLSGAAVAAETAVVAVEGIALVPFIATGLLIAGACAGGYAIYKAVND